MAHEGPTLREPMRRLRRDNHCANVGRLADKLRPASVGGARRSAFGMAWKRRQG